LALIDRGESMYHSMKYCQFNQNHVWLLWDVSGLEIVLGKLFHVSSEL